MSIAYECEFKKCPHCGSTDIRRERLATAEKSFRCFKCGRLLPAKRHLNNEAWVGGKSDIDVYWGDNHE